MAESTEVVEGDALNHDSLDAALADINQPITSSILWERNVTLRGRMVRQRATLPKQSRKRAFERSSTSAGNHSWLNVKENRNENESNHLTLYSCTGYRGN